MKNILFLLISCMLFACGNSTSQSPVSESDQKVGQGVEKTRKVEEFYPDGTRKVVGVQRGTTRIGRWQSYYPNGYQWSEVTYVDGHRQGPTVTYYNNGMMRYQGFYYNDERSGLWIFYDTTGVVLKRFNLDENVQIPDSLLH